MTMGYGLGLGRVFNVVANADGVPVKLDHAAAVTFVAYLDAGTQTISLSELNNGASEASLAVIDKLHKGPGVGGTWTEVTQSAAASFDLTTDATNDAIVVTVEASELSDGFNEVEANVDSGIVFAITHDLSMKRAPQNLPSSV